MRKLQTKIVQMHKKWFSMSSTFPYKTNILNVIQSYRMLALIRIPQMGENLQ